MLLNGLRSREVIALQLEDLLFGEIANPCARQRRSRMRLAAASSRRPCAFCDAICKTERPLTNAPEVFVCIERPRPRQSLDAGRIT